MSGYLEALVARTRGTPTAGRAVVRARHEPRFGPAMAPGGDDPASPGTGDAAPAVMAVPGTAPAPAPARAAAASPAVIEARGATVTAGDASPPAHPGTRESPAPAVDVGSPSLTPRRRDVPEPMTPPAPPATSEAGDPAPATQPAADAAPGPAVVRLRPDPERGSPPSSFAAAPEPRIEVHIGRVEVRRPAVAEPPAWAHGDAPTTRPAPRGFGDLAAARRYVDRLAR